MDLETTPGTAPKGAFSIDVPNWPKFNSTYEEYKWLRKQLGYDAEYGFVRPVWNNCTPDSQENMLQQLRYPVLMEMEREKRHGIVW